MKFHHSNLFNNSKVRFAWDTRSFVQVVKGETPDALSIATELQDLLDATCAYECTFYSCPRITNFFKVDIMLRVMNHASKMRCFKNLQWRNLFYEFRRKLLYFYTSRVEVLTIKCTCWTSSFIPPVFKNKSIEVEPCASRRDEAKKLDKLLIGMESMRGPHVLDTGVFLWLCCEKRLSNDLTLYIFDFI